MFLTTKRVKKGEYTVYNTNNDFVAEIEKGQGNYWVAKIYDIDWELDPIMTADSKKQLLEKLNEQRHEIVTNNKKIRNESWLRDKNNRKKNK
jgi:hypothetical protein